VEEIVMNDKMDLLKTELRVINIGIELFARSLNSQGVKVIQVYWKPPAEGDKELLKLLDELL